MTATNLHTPSVPAERPRRAVAASDSRYVDLAAGLAAAFCRGMLTASPSVPARGHVPGNAPSAGNSAGRERSRSGHPAPSHELTIPYERPGRLPSQSSHAAAASAVAAIPGARIALPYPHRPADAPDAAARPRASSGAARADLVRDLRRIWMGPQFRRTPCAVLAAAVRAATADAAAATFDAVRSTLAEFGRIYDVAPSALAVVMPNVSLHEAHRIAEVVAAAIEARSAQSGGGIALAAGVAALGRDDDPTTTVMRAETCLRSALAAPQSRVVAEDDPGIRARA